MKSREIDAGFRDKSGQLGDEVHRREEDMRREKWAARGGPLESILKYLTLYV